MKDIIPVGGTALQANTVLTDDIFSKWLHYTDVMPKSHATYVRIYVFLCRPPEKEPYSGNIELYCTGFVFLFE